MGDAHLLLDKDLRRVLYLNSALQGMLANSGERGVSHIAKRANEIADAMLAEDDKREAALKP